jgi:hypothetical protein
MYVLTLVVWSALGTVPAVDATKTFKTFEECEQERVKYNETYETDIQNNSIAGYDTSCKGSSKK